ncbi:TetR/AcrR family transcriptional regulator [Amycolatopsis eburnea]|uniref:TetR/AcrR family transcriptional regulator n=1 Tax=Amycolatopsis eburnea TaxID=2267691 RepID=A0A3R9DY72_9PSEU|nr:TetR/AcrR family transcriptional regulator C-terminal domain-containing protein [Amycolatopsis eburnea]RSD10412.1 TetR/AcrR family transcriptional regulator [Amycolatopsis eburnea]
MAQRRAVALSRAQIIGTAVELLDTDGESGLTFRALTERLATGPGAIYWHVANKGELLDAATGAVVADALAAERAAGSPRDEVRAVALGLFDAIEKHPWLAPQLSAQLSRGPSGPVTPKIFESIGRHVRDLGVPKGSWFTATSALVHYVLGAAGQNAANARVVTSGKDRSEFLDAVSAAWAGLDAEEYPFMREVAAEVRDHDDREQFLAGVDLILTGIGAVHSLP